MCGKSKIESLSATTVTYYNESRREQIRKVRKKPNKTPKRGGRKTGRRVSSLICHKHGCEALRIKDGPFRMWWGFQSANSLINMPPAARLITRNSCYPRVSLLNLHKRYYNRGAFSLPELFCNWTKFLFTQN